jgi:transcriptional regulator with XRE-family HTH domain
MMEVSMTSATLQQRLTSAGDFTKLLRQRYEATDRSQADMARDAWIDPGYLSKLLSGEKTNPSRDTVIRLAVFGLKLQRHDTDELLLAAEFAPLTQDRQRA